MRIDHVAFRVKDRHKTVEFFVNAFGYRIQTEFDIDFGDGEKARCFALEPPEKNKLYEKVREKLGGPNWTHRYEFLFADDNSIGNYYQEYHLAPEIFVSDGTPDSIVGKWVAHRDGIGSIHHIAYQVESVEEKMNEWKQKGYAEFTSDVPFKCEGLTQVFTKPSTLTGVVFEFIERGAHGFCKENVKQLMESTKNLDTQNKLTCDFPNSIIK